MNETEYPSFFNESFLNHTDFQPPYAPIEENKCHIPVSMMVTMALAYILVIILGVSGNLALIGIILRQKELRNVINILIINLSLSDLLVSFVCLPFTFVYILIDHWAFGEIICKLNPFVQCVSVTVSILSLVLIAWEHHQLIVNPRGWRPTNIRGFLAIGLIWFFSVGISLPFVIYQVLNDKPSHNVTFLTFKDKYVCFELFPSNAHRLFYTTALLVLQYFGPLMFITFCYLKIYIRLRARNDLMGRIRDNHRRIREAHRINLMIFSIVVAFAICWMPLTIFNTVFDWNHKLISICHHNVLFLLCHLTAMLSTCVNPVFYGFLNKNFQKDLHALFRSCNFRYRNEDYETIAMSTMNTDDSKASHRQAGGEASRAPGEVEEV